MAEKDPLKQGGDAESSPGSLAEAFSYVDLAIPAWRNTPGALEWLGETFARLEG